VRPCYAGLANAERYIWRYRYNASNFQSPMTAIESMETPASKAKEAPPHLKECVPNPEGLTP